MIVAAALYELSSLKDACLRRCRDPLALVRRERPGAGEGLRAGLGHGVVCIGCCWALMAALFASLVMSLGWMVLVAAQVAVEKLLPRREVAERGVALVLVLLGMAVAFSPASCPVHESRIGRDHDDGAEAMTLLPVVSPQARQRCLGGGRVERRAGESE
jgi:predicted metal-binding membrane protein